MTQRVLLVLLCSFFLSSCTCRYIESQWTFENDAINVHMKADEQANFHGNSGHPVNLCFYQLTSVSSFDSLTMVPERLNELLECTTLFDNTFLERKFISVQPGDHVTYHFDRVEYAKYVAVVASYQDFRRENVVRTYEIPVNVEKSGTINCMNFASPAELTIHLLLDKFSLRDYHGID